MQILVNMSDHSYEKIKKLTAINLDRTLCRGLAMSAINAIKNGKPLPKGHGKLIDEQVLWDSYHDLVDYDFYEALDVTPTVIEADRGDAE